MRNSLADVVSAALRVLDAQGLEGCSMRRVAAELEVQPSALYHHVPNKQTLLALMADEMVRGVGGDTARELCISLRDAMLAVCDGADVVAAATGFRLGSSEIEERLAGLVGADGARTLLLYTCGHAQSTQTHQQAVRFGALLTGRGAEIRGVDALHPGSSVSGADADSAAPVADPELELHASFERGLDIILRGLAG